MKICSVMKLAIRVHFFITLLLKKTHCYLLIH